MRVPRRQILRRKLNDAFYGFSAPDGSFSWLKFVGVWGQISALFHFGVSFDKLIDRPESLAIVLAFIVSPNLFSKLLSMKYGGGK